MFLFFTIFLVIFSVNGVKRVNENDDKIIIATEWFYSGVARRTYENKAALCMNLLNRGVEKVVLFQPKQFFEKDKDKLLKGLDEHCCVILNQIHFGTVFEKNDVPDNLAEQFGPSNDSFFWVSQINIQNAIEDKLVFVEREDTYKNTANVQSIMKYANENFHGKKIAIINLDIAFDATLQNGTHVDEKTAYFLSRHEVFKNKQSPEELRTRRISRRVQYTDQCDTKNYRGSHDAFIFKTPVREDSVKLADIVLGTMGIESKIAAALNASNVRLTNPCKATKIWHFHGERFPDKRGYIPPVKGIEVSLPRPEMNRYL